MAKNVQDDVEEDDDTWITRRRRNRSSIVVEMETGESKLPLLGTGGREKEMRLSPEGQQMDQGLRANQNGDYGFQIGLELTNWAWAFKLDYMAQMMAHFEKTNKNIWTKFEIIPTTFKRHRFATVSRRQLGRTLASPLP